MSAYIIDTETTGEEPVPEVIELGVLRALENITMADTPFVTEPFFLGRFKPTGRIRFSALAVHHILPEELTSEPSAALAKAHLPTDMEYMIGHNVDYDWNALGNPACKRICTLALARRIWPSNDGHSLGAMSYQLSSNLAETREALKSMHSAGDDAELCALLLQAMWGTEQMQHVDSWEALYALSEDARLPRYWTFGKHKGKALWDTDPGYLMWVVRQTDFDNYVREACKLQLKGQLTK